jgi:uncharacterized membrane protein
MVINPLKRIQSVQTFEDKIADKITQFSGSLTFVFIHALWFIVWILLNVGVFGHKQIFDKYPFGLLTLIVSLEAIFLSTFVMISQNRESNEADIRSQLDYNTDIKAEKTINIIMTTLARIADKQGVNISDLLDNLKEVESASDAAQLATDEQIRKTRKDTNQ